jgi:branched-chain amino acid transport system ATP-binding protein
MYLIGRNLRGGYGGVDILRGCTIGVEKGEIAVIVGPNGAGKSTAMKAMLGLLPLATSPCSARRRACAKESPSCRRRTMSSPA